MSLGLFFIVIGFTGHHVSYLSIFEVITGERHITDLTKPRLAKPIKPAAFHLSDNKRYFSVTHYMDSLNNIRKHLWQDKTKDQIRELLFSLPRLKADELEYWSNLKHLKSEEQYLNEYLNSYSNQYFSWVHYEMLPRAIFNSLKHLDKNQILAYLLKRGLYTEDNYNKIRSNYVVFLFDTNKKLVDVVSR